MGLLATALGKGELSLETEEPAPGGGVECLCLLQPLLDYRDLSLVQRQPGTLLKEHLLERGALGEGESLFQQLLRLTGAAGLEEIAGLCPGELCGQLGLLRLDRPQKCGGPVLRVLPEAPRRAGNSLAQTHQRLLGGLCLLQGVAVVEALPPNRIVGEALRCELAHGLKEGPARGANHQQRGMVQRLQEIECLSRSWLQNGLGILQAEGANKDGEGLQTRTLMRLQKRTRALQNSP
jgi:hypothetical protein